MRLLVQNNSIVSFETDAPLASTQGRKTRRDDLKQELSAMLRKVPFLFSSDVSVTIEIHSNEQFVYETDKSADIDNVNKPLLDALVGLDGLLIDDNQVERLLTYWLDSHEAKTVVTVESTLNNTVRKDGLCFVHVGNRLYFPLNMNNKRIISKLYVEALQNHIRTRERLESLGAEYREVSGSLPIQRYFHRTRLNGYELYEFDQFLTIVQERKVC